MSDEDINIQMIGVNRCRPMKALERRYYQASSYTYLKRIIKRDGYNKAYPIRAIYNKDTEYFEVFDGIHRLKAAIDLGLRTIPLINESKKLNRYQAIAEGIKANATHAYYSVIDVAMNLKALADNVVSKRNWTGRPEKYHLKELEKQTGIELKTIQNYLSLLKLPDDVIDLIGQGKLKMYHGIELLKLLPDKDKISSLAQSCYQQQLSVVSLRKQINTILSGITEEKICKGCKRVFPYESVSRLDLCPDCVGKLRSGEFERVVLESHNEARRKYLKLRAFMERHFPNDSVPEHFKIVLNEFHEKWNGGSDAN